MPRLRDEIQWRNLVLLNNKIANNIDNYKTEQAKHYRFKGALANRDASQALILQQERRSINNTHSIIGGVAGGVVGAVGYAAFLAGPTGWAAYGAYALMALGAGTMAASGVNYLNEGEWNQMISNVKVKLGYSGEVFNNNLQKFYNDRIMKPLQEAGKATMTVDEDNYNKGERKELEESRQNLINNVDRMLRKQDVIFDDLSTGDIHFIKAVTNFEKLIQDLNYIHKNTKTAYSPKILPNYLANQFDDLSKENQEGIIDGYVANFVACLALFRDGLDQNTYISRTDITPNQGCSII